MMEISVSEFKNWRDQGKEHQLIDVREEFEFEAANMGGELIPMGTIPDHMDAIRKDVPVVIHCKSGARSGNITRFLEQHGFTNVYNLTGGIFAWIDQIDPSLSKY
jgi:adenylyltransferase/sulfurtransferase